MARALRVEFEGAWYHVMARGNRREPIFVDEDDRAMMLSTLGEASDKSGWEVHAWVLMPNHFHFVIHTPRGNLVDGMRWFMNAYTRRLNARHRLWGRVFGDRYKSLCIEPPGHVGEPDYLRQLLWYVHLNPARAGLVRPEAGGRWAWETYPWNSLVKVYGSPPGSRAPCMRADMGLAIEQFSDSAAGRRMYRREADRKAEEWRATLRDDLTNCARDVGPSRGWYAGGDSFRDWLIDRLDRLSEGKRNRNYRESVQGHDHGLRRAERLIVRGCRFFGLKDAELRSARGGEPRRLAVARAIWKQTNVSQEWMARRLGFRSAGNVSQQLRRWGPHLDDLLGRKLYRRWLRLSGIDD